MASSMVRDGPGPVRMEPGTVLTRNDFPQDFLFGAATSAYQIEGAYNEGRRGLANWDTWSILKPGKVSGGSNGCVAIDHYNLFREDVKRMKKMGIDIYRFSIAWPRILPGGTLSSGLNREGVRFYNDLIDLLLEQGIEPIVTLFHFDVPKCLEDEYGGFLDKRIVQDYAGYAEVCFFEFGDRVKLWTTVNEAHTFAVNGYVTGSFPPGHGSPREELGLNNSFVGYREFPGIDRTVYGGNAATEPYQVGHNIILAHATAVDIYRTKYQAVQGGKIGIVNVINWSIPYSNKPEDVAAANRAIEFALGWFTEPLVTGDYPQSMRDRVKQRLPEFSPDEKILVKGSFDYLGLNYYTTYYAAYKASEPTNYFTDQEVQFLTERDGVPIGPQAGSEWLYIYPEGIYDVLTYAKEKYNDPIIYITENGVDGKTDMKKPIAALLQDDYRIDFHLAHLRYVKLAMEKDKVKVKTYIVWSIFDNYEWAQGYTVRFGMYYVDYVNGLTRYPKNSVVWYMNFLNRKRLQAAETHVEEEKIAKRKGN